MKGTLTRTVFGAGLMAAAFCLSCDAAAQSEVALDRRAKLEKLSQELQEKALAERQRAHELAGRKRLPLRHQPAQGRAIELQRFSPAGDPIYYITDNIDAADTVGTDELWPGGSTGLNLSGLGQNLSQWDEGLVDDTHPEFSGRVTQGIDIACAPFSAPGVSLHSTQIAGTQIAAGVGHPLSFQVPPGSDAAKGMAFEATLDVYDWNCDTSEMAAAAAAGEDISNHSYGIAAGWLFLEIRPPEPVECQPYSWWWFGGTADTDVEDYKFGYYDADAQSWDQVAHNAPDYLIVKSAGNDRSDVGPLGGSYCVLNAAEEFSHVSSVPRDSDCGPAGYDCLPTISNAKNILTVGAVDDLSGGYSPSTGPAAVAMTSFSGWGPTDDGRIKPDLVANGFGLVTPSTPLTISVLTFYYWDATGTSAAAPNASGSLQLLQEHYRNTHGGTGMQAATLKALAIHTADEAGSADGPDYAFGWGLLNIRAAADLITQDGGGHRIIEGTLSDGATDSVQIDINEPEADITATLVWTDPPGTPVAPSLDPPDLMLVNDLDLRIHSATGTHLPWILDPAAPASAATTGDNFRDNVEQVEIQGVGPGAYIVEITHKNTLLNNAPQDYALILSAAAPAPTSVAYALDEDFSGGLPTGWTTNPIGQTPDWQIIDHQQGHWKFENFTGGDGRFAIMDMSEYLVPTSNTDLRTGTLDLSAHAEVILEFQTHYDFDGGEIVTVDVSNDGGSNWTEVWAAPGIDILGPSLQVQDITSQAAGQSNVMLRFQFESNDYQGVFWQVDDVRLRVPGGPGSSDPCGGSYSLPANQWRFIALPCDPNTATVSAIFGDDLNPAQYTTHWVLWERDEANDQYVMLPDINATLGQGEGYFLLSVDPAAIDVAGTATTLGTPPHCNDPNFPDGECYEIPLVKHTDGVNELSNALGHPLPFPVDWADFRIRVVGEANLLTPSEAHALNYVEKVVHKYSGSAYVPYDDVTPGYSHGALGAFDAFWLKTMIGSHGAGAMSLLVPNKRSKGIITSAAPGPASTLSDAAPQGAEQAPPGQARRDAHRQAHRDKAARNTEWYVRLTVEAAADELQDSANVIGQLDDSLAGFDTHDLLEPQPFSPYLSIVFEHADWGEHANSYTSDFRAPSGNNKLERWAFEVISDDPAREVTLTWQGPADRLDDSLLIDQASGAVIEPGAEGQYVFVMGSERRAFTWEYRKHPGKGKKK